MNFSLTVVACKSSSTNGHPQLPLPLVDFHVHNPKDPDLNVVQNMVKIGALVCAYGDGWVWRVHVWPSLLTVSSAGDTRTRRSGTEDSCDQFGRGWLRSTCAKHHLVSVLKTVLVSPRSLVQVSPPEVHRRLKQPVLRVRTESFGPEVRISFESGLIRLTSDLSRYCIRATFDRVQCLLIFGTPFVPIF